MTSHLERLFAIKPTTWFYEGEIAAIPWEPIECNMGTDRIQAESIECNLKMRFIWIANWYLLSIWNGGAQEHVGLREVYTGTDARVGINRLFEVVYSCFYFLEITRWTEKDSKMCSNSPWNKKNIATDSWDVLTNDCRRSTWDRNGISRPFIRRTEPLCSCQKKQNTLPPACLISHHIPHLWKSMVPT